ncbi:hypothetical protein P4S72_00840 [Vibrio sp. PP-XX7]
MRAYKRLKIKGQEVICLADLPTDSLLGREDLDYLVTTKSADVS